MKKTDIAMIILIASISILGAFFATNALLGDDASEEVSVKTIEPIKVETAPVDPSIFNENAINPSVEVQVGTSGE